MTYGAMINCATFSFAAAFVERNRTRFNMLNSIFHHSKQASEELRNRPTNGCKGEQLHTKHLIRHG